MHEPQAHHSGHRHRRRHRAPLSASLGVWIAAALLAAGLLVYLLVRPEQFAGQGQRHRAVGLPLGQLQLRALGQGTDAVLLEDLRGRITLVCFWGTWCAPCVKELPGLVELDRQLRRSEKFQFLAVSCGAESDEDLDSLRQQTLGFVRQHQLDLVCYADPEHITRDALRRLGAFDDTLPTLVIVDEKSRIQAAWNGAAPSMGQLESLLGELLVPSGD